jgi:hypothetical protein
VQADAKVAGDISLCGRRYALGLAYQIVILTELPWFVLWFRTSRDSVHAGDSLAGRVLGGNSASIIIMRIIS